MRKFINKLKPIFLLLSLSLICFGIVFLVEQLRGVNSPKSAQASDVESINSQLKEETIIALVDSSVPKIMPDEENSEDEKEGEVLAKMAQGGLDCSQPEFTDIKSNSICKKSYSGKVSFALPFGQLLGGDTVKADATVILTEVTVPLELFSGVEVYDSNRLIKYDTPTLKPAGEQIDSLTGNVLLPPNTEIDTYTGWEEEKPFKTEYSVGFPEGVSDEGKIGVETKLPNACEYCNNKSNVNPDKSNKISEFMLNSTDRAPKEIETFEESVIAEECSSSDKFIPWEKRKYSACKLDVTIQLVEHIKNIPGWGMTIGNRLYCEVYPDECMKISEIIVIMASPFGSDKECSESGACTNSYMNSRNSRMNPPDTDFGGKTYYLTPCQAIVQGAFGVQNVKCAWDLSHLYKELEVNEYDDMPSVDKTPSKYEYEMFLQEKIQNTRGDEIPI